MGAATSASTSVVSTSRPIVPSIAEHVSSPALLARHYSEKIERHVAIPATHRVSDRRDDRDAVPPRRGRTRRWRVELHDAAARSAREAAHLGVHDSAVRAYRGA